MASEIKQYYNQKSEETGIITMVDPDKFESVEQVDKLFKLACLVFEQSNALEE